ncbi:ATP-binding protein [Flavobacteriaceae bacterium]|nr:ATP-binding protein [Flavobacteriaceae bacterium]
MSNEIIVEDSIFRVGRVISVDGRSIRVSVDKAKNSSHIVYKGDLIKNVSVGSYIKIIKGFTIIIGKIEGEFTYEDKIASTKEYSSDKEKINRSLSVSLLGFFNKKEFERGIKEMPLVDNECYLLDRKEFNQVHDFIRKTDEPLVIGTLTLEKGQTITVGIDSLFASHIGIFGNTGSGKSYTLAKLYFELFKIYKDNQKFKQKSNFFLLDFNGEYVTESENVIIPKDYKNIYRLTTKSNDGQKYPISKETLNDHSFWAIVLEATEKTQTPFLRRAINNDFLAERIKQPDNLKELIIKEFLLGIAKNDKELGLKVIVEFLSELHFSIPNSNLLEIRDNLRERVQYHNTTYQFMFVSSGGTRYYDEDMASRITDELEDIVIPQVALNDLDVLKLQIIFQYYDEIIKGFANIEHLAPLIKRLGKNFSDIRKVIEAKDDVSTSKNFTIVSLKDVNIHMRKILPLLLCKQLYEEQKTKNDDTSHLNIIIDEAHNILSRDSNRESEQWKDYRLETFEEIIKEGRKFGVFLTLASQRPSDISPTIISQLHNYFLHRLINNNDIIAVEKTISYLDKLSFEYLPILPTGTCILAGLSAQVPVVIDIGAIDQEFEPNNKTRSLIENWKE